MNHFLMTMICLCIFANSIDLIDQATEYDMIDSLPDRISDMIKGNLRCV